MKEFCECIAWQELKETNPSIFKWDNEYGWVITWIELTTERGYKQIHNYGISIKHCPLCGKKLKGQ
jgi:hypothetical protein